MVKHTQTIRRYTADELSVFDHFVGFALKGLKKIVNIIFTVAELQQEVSGFYVTFHNSFCKKSIFF